ncbi:MAG: hypothetical protein QF473_14020, partial [Planctomycetota bacterium]|nr:hypothetical protein [Planctomycetota bacterium]
MRKTHSSPSLFKCILGVMPIILSLSVASAGDWPTWRSDAGRTGVSPDELPEKLRLQWRRDLPPVVPAWP